MNIKTLEELQVAGIFNQAKKVKGFESYVVTQSGNVYNTDIRNFKQLTPYLDALGHPVVILELYGFTFNKRIKDLVASAFLDRPSDDFHIVFLDGDKKNCDVRNMEYQLYKS